jgi:hypothetical protein
LSYDLTVFASDLPDLAAALEPETLEMDGDVPPIRGSVALLRSKRGRSQHLCTIDGPLEAEDDDAPEEVDEVLLACRWTVQISCPDDLSKAALGVVERVARRLSDSGRGVLYDPQQDEIVWPRSPQKLRHLPKSSGEDVARVELEWPVARRLSARDAHAVLHTLRQLVPEAVPVRFGDYEPMQGRLERDGDDAFAALWEGHSSPFWKGRYPVGYGFVNLRRGWGSALTQAERDARTPMLGGRKAIEVDSLTLEFGTAVVDDDRWLSLIKRLFVTVARQLNCYLAAAYCSPNDQGEMVRLLGRYWLGIPAGDQWLVWVGPPYRSVLPTGAKIDREFEEGALLQLGSSPIAFAELRRNKIDWPPQWLRGGGHLEDTLAASVIPDLAGARPLP